MSVKRPFLWLAALAPSFAVAAALSGCAAADSSPHPHDVVLGEGQRYEKNPDVKLAREYWIVVAAEDESRFMFPRPDGDPRVVEECTTRGPLAGLLEGAMLCTSATSASLSRVNSLTRSEAMQVSTFLHGKLRFTATAAGAEGVVSPYPLRSDLRDLCEAFAADRSGTLRATCDRELATGDRPAIAVSLTAEEARVIAARLNELYGIP